MDDYTDAVGDLMDDAWDAAGVGVSGGKTEYFTSNLTNTVFAVVLLWKGLVSICGEKIKTPKGAGLEQWEVNNVYSALLGFKPDTYKWIYSMQNIVAAVLVLFGWFGIYRYTLNLWVTMGLLIMAK